MNSTRSGRLCGVTTAPRVATVLAARTGSSGALSLTARYEPSRTASSHGR